MKLSSLSIFGISAVALGVGAAQKTKQEKLDYNRDIRPILAAKCFACHGNDPKAIRAGLRLDSFEGATGSLRNGIRAIVPNHPEKSELIRRVFSKSDDDIMPPPDTNKKLTVEEKETLKRWISEGAEYKLHWAFVPPVRPALPVTQNKTWARNEIDEFVLAKLEASGLKPSPEADRPTLIRRVSLDLTGLPPTPSETAAFLADKSPNAYEKVVDRLLASPQYGERMAMDWVDYARYADSNGYQADFERYQWRWRDWVINAFNKNMPYDKFTVEQLAGDMLPNATLDQKIASGFNRNHRINTEGGVIAEEWRVETVIDRVETTSAVWLGLTAGCARCHDHKYDPVTQKEFYSMYAYFNNVSESGTGEERPVNHPPYIQAPSPEQVAKIASLKSQISNLDALLKNHAVMNIAKASDWKLEDEGTARKLKEGLVAHYEFGANSTSEGSVSTPNKIGSVKFEKGHNVEAVRTRPGSYLDLGNVGDFDGQKAFAYSVWVNPADGNGSPISKMDSPDAMFQGWDLFLNGFRPMVHLINSWPSNSLKVTSKEVIPANKWTHIAMSYDGSRTPQGISLYINGKRVQTDTETNSLTGSIKTKASAKVGTRTRNGEFNGGVESLYLFDRTLSTAEVSRLAGSNPVKDILLIPAEKRSETQRLQLAALWSSENDKSYQTLDSEMRRLQSRRDEVSNSIPSVMVMDEMKKPREAHVLIRGQYDKYGDKVGPSIPAALGSLPKGAPNNRLGFAEWIASPKNPLTARVTVNRLWERFFGIGIVETSEDFGTRAAFPSHPELLDWLATEFMRTGWDLKATMKEIAMSATYRQTSSISPWLVKNDPANRLLARGPRFRLPAEVIRDQALAASGMLVEKIGGPSVRPYEPEGIWDETNRYGNLLHYKHDNGDGLHRRSLYTIWKRTAAPPNMTLFDVPSREICRVRRGRTNTPLQALTLMNDETYLEASRVLAQRMLLTRKTPAERLAFAFQSLLARDPKPNESKVLLGGIDRLIAEYRRNPKAATSLVNIGDSPRNGHFDDAELAAYMVTASTLFNLDEAITKE